MVVIVSMKFEREGNALCVIVHYISPKVRKNMKCNMTSTIKIRYKQEM